MARIALLAFAGLLSVPLMEVGGVLWMRLLPLDLDLTASYFTMVVLPVALILHFLMALLFWKAFEPQPRVGGPVYLLTHIAVQGITLTLLEDPFADVFQYLLMLAISGSLILFVFNRYFWCPKCVALD